MAFSLLTKISIFKKKIARNFDIFMKSASNTVWGCATNVLQLLSSLTRVDLESLSMKKSKFLAFKMTKLLIFKLLY